MRRELALQGPLQDGLDQLAEQGALAGQPQPARLVAGPLQQGVQQPVVHQLQLWRTGVPGRPPDRPHT
jgi:hypothetical protein